MFNTKAYIESEFPNVSRPSIKCIHDEWMIVGKFCQVTPMAPGVWDLFICNRDDFDAGLGQGKVNNIVNALKSHRQEAMYTVCNGEAFASLQGKEIIEDNLRLLGIKVKRKIKPETLEKMKKNLFKRG